MVLDRNVSYIGHCSRVQTSDGTSCTQKQCLQHFPHPAHNWSPWVFFLSSSSHTLLVFQGWHSKWLRINKRHNGSKETSEGQTGKERAGLLRSSPGKLWPAWCGATRVRRSTTSRVVIITRYICRCHGGTSFHRRQAGRHPGRLASTSARG